MRYLAMGDFLTLGKYRKAITMLRSQVAAKKPARFGRTGGGPCPYKGKNNEYESDALDIYEEEMRPTNKKRIDCLFVL